MVKFFKFKTDRDPGCIKLVFFAGELRQKPIKYWANVGHIPKYSRLTELIKRLKSQVDVKWANNITHIAYYGGVRLTFPIHVHWMEDRFEMTVYSVFGEGKPRLHLGRKVNSNNERFTDEEIKRIKKFIETEYHLIWDGSELIRKYMEGEKGHSEVRAKLKLIESHITNGFK